MSAPEVGVLLLDGRGQVAYLNGAAETLLGLARARALGRPVEEVVRVDGADEGLDARARAARAGQPLPERAVTVVREAGGPARLVERVEATGASADGGPAGVVVTLRDPRAAARGRALEAFADGEASTPQEVARRLVQGVVPALADMAVVRLEDGEAGAVTAHAHADPARAPLVERVASLLRLQADAGDGDALRLDAPTLSGLSPAGLDRLPPPARAALRDVGVASFVAVPLRGRGGVGLLALATSEGSLSREDQALASALGRRAERALERAWLRRRLRDVARRHERMLAQLGHDLKNPAAAIKMAADVLLTRLPPGDPGTSLRMIQRSADKLNALIQTMLDDSAAEAAAEGE